jgi:hypothetical protein
MPALLVSMISVVLQDGVWRDCNHWGNFPAEHLKAQGSSKSREGRVVCQPSAREYTNPEGVYGSRRKQGGK